MKILLKSERIYVDTFQKSSKHIDKIFNEF